MLDERFVYVYLNISILQQCSRNIGIVIAT